MENLYFLSEEIRIVFGLVCLTGYAQMEFLGIDYEHYSNREVAENWYRKFKKILENTNHPKTIEAMENLEKLYKGMIKK